MQHLNYCPDFLSSFSRFGTIDERNCEKMELPFHLFQKSVPFLPNSATSSRENHAKTMHPQSSQVNIDCSPNLCCENSMGLHPHLLNQITFEHEIQDTKFYGVSKMKTNSIYYYIVNHFGCFLLCNLEFFLLRHYTYFNAEFSPFLNNLDSCNTKCTLHKVHTK